LLEQLTYLAQQLVNGLMLSSIYVLVALSATVVFGLTGIVNFAVGELMMIGAFIALVLVQAGVPFAFAVLIAVGCLAVAGLLIERFLFRWTLPRPDNGFIVSLGMILILQAIAVELWGSGYRSIPLPLAQTITLGSVVVGAQALVILGVSLGVLVGFTIWLYKSRNGRALRAASEDREVAQLMGVPVLRLTAIVFAVGIGFAGLAGALVSSVAVVQPFMSANYLLKGFIIAIVGGLGNVTGTFVVGLFVALTEALSAQYLPIEWINGYVGLSMILILLIRPSGLFGIQRG